MLQGKALELDLAAMMDMRDLISLTYETEGDQLELLLVYERIENFLARGKAIKGGNDGVLRNVDALLRSRAKLQNGVRMSKVVCTCMSSPFVISNIVIAVQFFAGPGMCEAKIIGRRQVTSDLYPGQRRVAYSVQYEIDNQTQEFEEEELRPLLLVRHLPERKAVIDSLVPAFEYLEDRLSGACQAGYSCKDMYSVSSQPLPHLKAITPDVCVCRLLLTGLPDCSRI